MNRGDVFVFLDTRPEAILEPWIDLWPVNPTDARGNVFTDWPQQSNLLWTDSTR
jgi:hypothetical protein